LDRGERADGVLERFHVSRGVRIGIRRGLAQGYIVDVYFACRRAGVPSRAIGQSISNDRQEPGHEGPRRIVRRADDMQRQEDVLDEVLNVFGSGEPPLTPNNPANTGRHGAQQLEISGRISQLGRTHPRAKLIV
jgi:hypothetical protein